MRASSSAPITLLGGGFGNFKNQLNAFPAWTRPAIRKITSLFPGSGLSPNFTRDLSAHVGRKVNLFDTDTWNPAYLKTYKDMFAPGSIVANFGTPAKGLKGKVFGQPVSSARASKLWENKELEAQYLKGILPDTTSVSSLIKEFGINTRSRNAGQQIMDAARQKYGDKFLLKPITSYQSDSSLFPTYKTDPQELLQTLRGGIENNTGDVIGRGLKNWVVQKKFDLKNPGLLDKVLNRIGGFGSGAREYRVHAIGNKVIPYATAYRGSTRVALPYHTSEMAMVEKELQRLLDKNLSRQHKNIPFGFDVLIGKDGKIIPIEANPATLVGSSGLASMPHTIDAIASHLAGKTPLYILRQQALERAAKNTAAGTAVLAPTLYGLSAE